MTVTTVNRDIETVMTESATVHNPVHALAASPTFAKDGICFAAHTAGLASSEDGGRTWRDAYTALELRQR